jgi:hypothetical protein
MLLLSNLELDKNQNRTDYPGLQFEYTFFYFFDIFKNHLPPSTTMFIFYFSVDKQLFGVY